MQQTEMEVHSDRNRNYRCREGRYNHGKIFCYPWRRSQRILQQNRKQCQRSGKFCNTKYFSELDSLIEVSDTLFITVTDGAIKEVWDCIAAKDVKGKSVCHFSGSLSSDIFSNAEQAGVSVCSLHPIYAFSNKFTAYQNLTEAIFTVEGDEQAVADIYRMFEKLPNRLVLDPYRGKNALSCGSQYGE